MPTVFRITRREEWQAALHAGELAGAAHDQRDGFLHCSAAHQVPGTLATHYENIHDLVLLHISLAALPAALVRWEASRGGELFPHLYGRLPVSAVTQVSALPAEPAARAALALDDDGAYAHAQDRAHMARAIALALPGVGHTGDNPSVGCVIALGATVLAEAATAPGGRPHAEEQAVALLPGGELQKATAYVTLEPCGARSSGQPSCSMLLAERRIGRVVIACADPSPYAAGRGVERLRKAGIPVALGLLADEALAALYADYVARLRGR